MTMTDPEVDWMSQDDPEDELIASAVVQAHLSECLRKVTAQIIEAEMRSAPRDVVAALIAEQQDVTRQLNPLSERIAELDALLVSVPEVCESFESVTSGACGR